MTQSENPWQTVSSRVAYSNPWFTVREDQVIRPDGNPGIYGVVQLPPSVGIVTIDDRRRVALVKQWRYVHGRLGLEIPTGAVDPTDDTDEAAARRELREETGISASRWKRLGQIENSNGATTDLATMFLATDLQIDQSFAPAAHEPTVVQWTPFETAIELISREVIRESTSIAALLLASREI